MSMKTINLLNVHNFKVLKFVETMFWYILFKFYYNGRGWVFSCLLESQSRPLISDH